VNTKIKKKEVLSRLTSPVIFLFLCIYILITTHNLSVRAFRYVRGVTIILLILSLIELFVVIANFRNVNTNEFLPKGKKYDNKKVLIAIGLFFLYIYALGVIGFYVSTFLIIFSYMVLMGASKNYKYLAIIPAGVIFFIYLIFQKLLNVPIH